MDYTKGDKIVHVPATFLVAGIATVGIIASEICKVIRSKQ